MNRFSFISLLLLLVSSFMWGKKESKVIPHRSLFNIEFKKNKVNHQYILKQGNSKYLLIFRDGKKTLKKQFISQDQAEFIKGKARKILWRNKYKSKSIKGCIDYVTLKLDKDRTVVCAQNTKLVGQSYGFLNALRSFF